MRTSASDPLRIDFVETGGGGRIGMTICPGKRQTGAMSGTWRRELARDVDAVRDFGATVLVTLMEEPELASLGVPCDELSRALAALGIAWVHLPIRDFGVPDSRFEAAWRDAGADLRERVRDGQSVVIHCKGGLGRTGTIAARLLIELGWTAADAIAEVRRVRDGAIENAAQERYVRSIETVRR